MIVRYERRPRLKTAYAFRSSYFFASCSEGNPSYASSQFSNGGIPPNQTLPTFSFPADTALQSDARRSAPFGRNAHPVRGVGAHTSSVHRYARYRKGRCRYVHRASQLLVHQNIARMKVPMANGVPGWKPRAIYMTKSKISPSTFPDCSSKAASFSWMEGRGFPP